MRKAVNIQVITGFLDQHFREEYCGHVLVEMLPRVDDYFGNVFVTRQCPGHGDRLNELRSGPYNCENFQWESNLRKNPR